MHSFSTIRWARYETARIHRRVQIANAWKGYCLLGSHIPDESHLLDVGCGSGYLGYFFQQYKRCSVVGVDIQNWLAQGVEPAFALADGRHLPFSRKSTDAVILSYILHHTPHKEMVIADACRVARHLVAILEDVPESRLDTVLQRLHYRFSPWSDNSETLCKACRHDEWMDLLSKFNARIQTFCLGRFAREPWLPMSRRAYLLYLT
jgi:ubiquinone/menaquinone biosynthesis C-methylase UbiE